MTTQVAKTFVVAMAEVAGGSSEPPRVKMSSRTELVRGLSFSQIARYRGLQPLVGLPEQQCVSDPSVAEKLGIDLSNDRLEDRRVSGTLFQRTSFDCVCTPSPPFSFL